MARPTLGSNAIAAPEKTWLLGQVSEFFPDTHTYNVVAEGRMFRGVQRLLDHPGDATGLPRNTLVAMHRELGDWIIAGVVNMGSAGRVELAPVRVTEYAEIGAGDPMNGGESVGDARDANAPSDVAAGDWVRHGAEGQLLALLAGGTVVAKASPLAQVRLHQQNDLVEIISHLYRHITTMGEAEVHNEEGQVWYSWYGGTNQTNETGADVENYTIKLEVGATPSGDMLVFETLSPNGVTQARLAITAEGRIELKGTSLDLESGAQGTTTQSVAGDKAESVEGAVTRTVGADITDTIGGARTTQVSKTDSRTVGGDAKDVVNGDVQLFTGGGVRQKVMGGGPVPPPLPSAKAGVYEFINGGVEVVLGNPISGALPSSLQTEQHVNYVGGFHFAVQPTALPWPIGGFTVMSPLPASVHLGVDGVAIYDPITGTHKLVPVPGVFGVMKFEPWMALMQVLLTWLDTHVHQSPVGPTSPPLVPVTPLVSPLTALVRSLRVSVGL